MPTTTSKLNLNYDTTLTSNCVRRALVRENGGATLFIRSAVVAAFALLAGPSIAQAQQTETYAYDVHGRLSSVTRAAGGSSQTTTYGLDKADNRTSRTVSAPFSALASPGAEEAQASVPAAGPQETDPKPEAQTAPNTAAPSGGLL